MMTDENIPESSLPHVRVDAIDDGDKKGQMLVIYLPEGSVIVDRTDINLSNAPKEIVDATTAVVQQVVATPIAQPVVAAVAEQVVAAPVVAVQPPQPIVAEIPAPSIPTLQEMIAVAVAEALQAKTLIQTPAPAVVAPVEAPVMMVPVVAPISERVVVPPVDAPFATPTQKPTPTTMPKRIVVHHKRKINWVHGINTLFVAYILAISIIPAILSSAFGITIWASKVSHPGASIFQGDLMVCSEVPASFLKANDVILVRNGYSWKLDPRLVTGVTTVGNLSTIGTVSTAAVASTSNKSYIVAKDSQSYQITRIIPKLGFVTMILSSLIAKILIGLFILVLNLIVHYRRAKKRRRQPVLVQTAPVR